MTDKKISMENGTHITTFSFHDNFYHVLCLILHQPSIISHISLSLLFTAKAFRTPIFFINELLMAFSAFAFAGAQSYAHLAALGSFFGFLRGVWAGLYWTVLTDNFGEELLHKTSGLIGFAAGIMIFCVPPFAGW